MDELFRLVFNNKVIRKNIFNIASNLNKIDCNIPIDSNSNKIKNKVNINYKLYGYKFKDENQVKQYQIKKYNQCKINWICQNKHFQLLIYKLKVDIKKRIEFDDDLFFKCFLKFNSNLELLKEIFKLYPNYLPNDKINNNSEKLIQYSSSWEMNNNSNNDNNSNNSNLEIIKYLINELNIKPTLISLNNACGSINGKLVEYYLFGNFGFDINQVIDIGTLYCSIKSNNFNLFKRIIEIKSELLIPPPPQQSPYSFIRKNKIIVNLIKTKDVRFIKFYNEFIQMESKSFKEKVNEKEFELMLPYLNEYIISNGTLEIIKYICNNTSNRESSIIKYDKLIGSIVSRCSSNNNNNDLSILKYLIEEFKYYEKLNENSKLNLYSTFCCYDNLNAILYLEDTIKRCDLLVGKCAMDRALNNYYGTDRLNVFYWLFENRYEGCSDKGFGYVCENLSKYEKEFKLILSKYRDNISNDTIVYVLIHKSPFRDIDNFNYLSSFLPTYLIPDKSKQEFYD